MKLSLIGNYGATNVGDDAILTALLRQFSDHSVTVFSANPDLTKVQFGVKVAPLFPLGFRSVLKGRFYQSFKALSEVDAVVLGGGGLFQDNYLYACFLWAWQLFWVKRLNKPLFIHATGVGPLKTKMGKRLTRWAYRLAKMVTVRDAYSYDMLLKLGVSKNKLRITADPVFTYKTIQKKTPRKKRYLISLRPWLHYNVDIIDVFARVLEKISNESGVEFVFVGMQGIKESDHKVAEIVRKRVGGRWFTPRHFSELLHEMQQADMAIGMRYHFLIAAMLTHTPCLPVSYAPKVSELFKGTPLWPYVIPIEELSNQLLFEKIQMLSGQSESFLEHLNSRTAFLRDQVKKNKLLFDDFVKTVDPKAAE